MKVAARITWAAALVSATSLFVDTLVDHRAETSTLRGAYEAEARSIAAVLRSALESRGGDFNLAQLQRMSRESSRDIGHWHIEIVTRDAMSDRSDTSAPVNRLRALDAARAGHIWSESDGRMIYTLPLLVAEPGSLRGTRLIGSVEVSRNTPAALAAWTPLLRALPLPLLLIVGLVALAVQLQTRRVVTHPIEKLLVGMDDVTKGDLSHALLAEREDEIGQLASRFNDMTQSLRASRAETVEQTAARSSAEQKLRSAEKMATIGQMAAEIAHEVGTPLNVIAGRAKTVARKAKDPKEVTKNAEIISEQTARITRIIQRLLDIARKKATEQVLEDVQVGDVLRKTLEFLDARLRDAGVEQALELSDETPVIQGYPDQLEQVFINLILNAAEAMSTGGTLTVRSRQESRQRPGLERAPEVTCAVIELEDSGPGIPETDRERVFEPFYTTKEDEGGTGLGLAVSSSIIKEHDGWIEVGASALGGACFRVCLPVPT